MRKSSPIDLRERRAEHGDRRGEDQPRLVAVAGLADRLEQQPGAIEIDAVALVEIGFRLAGDDGREVEDEIGPVLHERGGGPRPGEIAGDGGDRCRGARLLRHDDIGEHQLVQIVAADAAIGEEPGRQLASDHAGGADDQDLDGAVAVTHAAMCTTS